MDPLSSNITAYNVSCDVPTEPPTLLPASDLPEVLAEYAEFHAKARACLLSESCNPKPPVLIWYCFISYCGGLGDRIRFMRITTMLAVLTGRVIFLHWPVHDNYDIRVAFTPTYIDWTLPSTTLLDAAMENATLRLVFPMEDGTMEDPLVNQSLPDDIRPRLNLFTSDLKAWIKSFPIVSLNPWMNRYELQRFMRNQHADQRLKELSYYHLYDLETLFTRFIIRPSAAVSATAQRIGFPLGTEYIGVHVRTGLDYKGADDPQRFATIQAEMQRTTRKFVECAQRIDKSSGRRNTDTKKRVFVASDSQELKTEFKRLGRPLKMDVRGGTRISWHISIGAPGEITQDHTARCQAFIETFADAYALGGAKHVVFIESGFPRFGVTMGMVDTWQVLDVETPLNATNCYTDYMLRLDVLPRGHVDTKDTESS